MSSWEEYSREALITVVELVRERSWKKQQLHKLSVEIFQKWKGVLKTLVEELSVVCEKEGIQVRLMFRDKGTFEAEMVVGGDVLIYALHTNIFTFQPDHFVHKLPYVQEDRSRAYCAMIQIYNFLYDSLEYKRMEDVGYLIARVFFNADLHFFTEGKRQLGFLYSDFENNILNEEAMKAVSLSALLYALDFELLVPPYHQIQEITVGQKIAQEGIIAIKTGKRLGFVFGVEAQSK